MSGYASRVAILLLLTPPAWLFADPTVTFVTPAPEGTVAGAVHVQVNATDSVDITKVEFLVDGVFAYRTAGLPYSFGWDTTDLSDGPHTLTAVAFNSNNVTGSSATNVTVSHVGVTTVPQQPALVYTFGRQLLIQRRLSSGALAPAAPYVIKGFTWTPANVAPTRGYNPFDPSNPAGYTSYGYFFDWNGRNPQGHVIMKEWGRNRAQGQFAQDISLMNVAHANTVRLFSDFGDDPAVYKSILDEFYRKGILVVMTVAATKDDITSGRYLQTVALCKNHPAILMWALGNEWNLNRYFNSYPDYASALAATEAAAQQIKAIDANHPVSSSLGDRFNPVSQEPSSDIPAIVQGAPSVDVWALNIYRNASFGSLFTQWAAVSSKPFYLSEFGTDAVRTTAFVPPTPPSHLAVVTAGTVDEPMQAQFDTGLWNELKARLSGSQNGGVAIGGFVHQFSDEPVKAGNFNFGMGGVVDYNDGQPHYQQYDLHGFYLAGSHPDNMSNEEFYGAVQADRTPRQLFSAMQTYWTNLSEPGPAISITSPADGNRLHGTTSVLVDATNNDPIAGVQLKIDGENYGAEDTAAPYTFSWNTAAVTDGTHTLIAVARDRNGNTATSPAVTVTVDNEAPTVALATPTAGSRIGGLYTLTADAADNDQVTFVQFSVDGAVVGQDSTAPFEFAWNTTSVSNGTHAITVMAQDRTGNTSPLPGTRTTITVDNLAPTVRITKPLANAKVKGTVVAVTANAADAGGISSVQFKLDGADLGALDVTSPFTIAWDSTAISDGPHQLKAQARDNAGNLTLSAPINVTVDNNGPLVEIQAPLADDHVKGTVRVAGIATDMSGVAGVQFKLTRVSNGVTSNIGVEDTVAPFAVLWATTGLNGDFRLTMVARDTRGNYRTSEPVAVFVDNILPTVAITSPTAASRLNGTITISANAADNDRVIGVQFKIDGVALGASVTEEPYEVSWDTTKAKNAAHSITAVVTDDAGNAVASAAKGVTVDNAGPVTAISAPVNNAKVRGSAVTLTATATDAAGVDGIQFLLDGTPLGPRDSASPYTLAWDTTASADGAHQLRVEAQDRLGNISTSAAITVTVDNTGPVATILAPVEGAHVRGTVTISGIATDPSVVAGVQFKLIRPDSSVANIRVEDTVAPYAVSWVTTGLNGSYKLIMVSRDRLGNYATSPEVNVVVDNGLLMSAPTRPLSVALTSPSARMKLQGIVDISAAVLGDASPAGVQFKVDGGYEGPEILRPPFTTRWDTRFQDNGVHILTAVARDIDGNTASSTDWKVEVDNTVTPTPSGGSPYSPEQPSAGSERNDVNIYWPSAGADAIKIACSLGQPSHVRVTITLPDNSRTVEVTDTDLEAGDHDISWNVPSGFPSGLCLAHVTINGQEQRPIKLMVVQ